MPVKYYNGTSWVTYAPKYYSGAAWVEPAVKYWNGSSWVTVHNAVTEIASITLTSAANATSTAYGFRTGDHGSVSPTTVDGANIVMIRDLITNGYFYFQLNDGAFLPDDWFTYLTINGKTYYTADANTAYFGTTKSWYWTSGLAGLGVGTYTVKVYR